MCLTSYDIGCPLDENYFRSKICGWKEMSTDKIHKVDGETTNTVQINDFGNVIESPRGSRLRNSSLLQAEVTQRLFNMVGTLPCGCSTKAVGS